MGILQTSEFILFVIPLRHVTLAFFLSLHNTHPKKPTHNLTCIPHRPSVPLRILKTYDPYVA